MIEGSGRINTFDGERDMPRLCAAAGFEYDCVRDAFERVAVVLGTTVRDAFDAAQAAFARFGTVAEEEWCRRQLTRNLTRRKRRHWTKRLNRARRANRVRGPR